MREICDSAALVDRGKGIRFMVERQGETLPAFAIRYGGRVYAYLNQCPHLGGQLDWIEGEFFDSAALSLDLRDAWRHVCTRFRLLRFRSLQRPSTGAATHKR